MNRILVWVKTFFFNGEILTVEVLFDRNIGRWVVDDGVSADKVFTARNEAQDYAETLIRSLKLSATDEFRDLGINVIPFDRNIAFFMN